MHAHTPTHANAQRQEIGTLFPLASSSSENVCWKVMQDYLKRKQGYRERQGARERERERECVCVECEGVGLSKSDETAMEFDRGDEHDDTAKLRPRKDPKRPSNW